ncbi:unnamed protein product, partial [Lymnaea stagnalis]
MSTDAAQDLPHKTIKIKNISDVKHLLSSQSQQEMTSGPIGRFTIEPMAKGRRHAGKPYVSASARKCAANGLRMSVFNSPVTRSEENIPLMPQNDAAFDDQRHGESQFLVQKLPHTVRLRTSSLTSDASSQRSKGMDSGNSSLIDSSSTDSYPDFGGGRSRTTSTSRSYQNLAGDRSDAHDKFHDNDGASQKFAPEDPDLGPHQETLDLTVICPGQQKFDRGNRDLAKGGRQHMIGPAGKWSQSVEDCAGVHGHFRKTRSREFSSVGHVCYCPRHSLSNIKETDVTRRSTCGGSMNENMDLDGMLRENETKLPEKVVGNVAFRRTFSTGDILNRIGLESVSSRRESGGQSVQPRALSPNRGELTHVSQPLNGSPASPNCSYLEPAQKCGLEKSPKPCTERMRQGYALIPESETDFTLGIRPGRTTADSSGQCASKVPECSGSSSVCVCCPSCSLPNDFKATQDYFTASREHDLSHHSTSEDDLSHHSTSEQDLCHHSTSEHDLPHHSTSKHDLSHQSRSEHDLSHHSTPGSIGASLDHEEKASCQSIAAGRGHAANLQSVLGYGSPWSYSAVKTTTKNSHNHVQPLQVLVPKLVREKSPSPQANNRTAAPHMKHSISSNELPSGRDLGDSRRATPPFSPRGLTACEHTENAPRDYGSYAPGDEGSDKGSHINIEMNSCGCVGSPLDPFELPPRNASSDASHERMPIQNIPGHQEICLHAQRDISHVTYHNRACENETEISNLPHVNRDGASSCRGNATKTQLYQYPTAGYEHCGRGFAIGRQSPCQGRSSVPGFLPENVHNSAVQTTCRRGSLRSNRLVGAPRAESTAGNSSSQMSSPDGCCLEERYQTGVTLSIPVACFEPDFFSPQNVSPGSHRSLPSSVDSGQGGNNQPSLQNTSQMELIKVGQRQASHPFVGSNREIPDYKILCLVAAIFNPILGMLAYFCNCYARQHFSAYRYNRANSLYLASITLSTAGIFVTLIGAALLAAHTVTEAAKPLVPISPVSAFTLACYNAPAEGEEVFMKFFEMDHRLYCELSQRPTIMDALRHYQIMDGHKRTAHRLQQETEMMRSRNGEAELSAGESLDHSNSSSFGGDDDALDDLQYTN